MRLTQGIFETLAQHTLRKQTSMTFLSTSSLQTCLRPFTCDVLLYIQWELTYEEEQSE
jgi:hypothetical protein